MFDPYHKWLGISKEEQPPTHYRLLGINTTEQDPEVIEEAALRQTVHVRAYQIGPHATQCARLLNEIAQARATLLDAGKRRAYDARLAEQQTLVARPRPAASSKSGRNLAVIAVVVGVVVLGGGLLVWSLTGDRDSSAKNKEPIVKKEFIKDAAAKKSKRSLTNKPVARWVFDASVRDTIGKLHGVLDGKPQFMQGKLRLGPTDRVLTPELPFDISERTLEAFVSLPVNNQKTGIVMKIEQGQGSTWDGIIFSDFTPGRWTPGSSYRHRSMEFEIPAETAGPSDVVHLATAYARDNSITLYRNGKVLGAPFTPQGTLSSLQTYRKGEARIQFGGGIVCDLIEARLYDRALTWKEIATSYQETVPEPER